MFNVYFFIICFYGLQMPFLPHIVKISRYLLLVHRAACPGHDFLILCTSIVAICV